MSENRNLRLTVLGGGAVGVTTALELQKEFGNTCIKIVAEKYNANTSSAVGPGIFGARKTFCGPNENITKNWIDYSYKYWDKLRQGEPKCGVREISGHVLGSDQQSSVELTSISHLLPLYETATKDELDRYNPQGHWRFGTLYTTLQIDCLTYLPWAVEKFFNAGGKLVTKKITDFQDLYKDSDIVVNCSGMGAKYLCDDKKLVPVRGEIIKVKAPWINKFSHADNNTFITPVGNDIVHLQGAYEFNEYNIKMTETDESSIFERCASLLPQLVDKDEDALEENKTVKIGTSVGLVPYRCPVRVEREEIKGLRIVHNYGHGDNGVSQAPGTAIHAVALVQQAIMEGKSKESSYCR